jgi:hypothetical protein
VRAACCPLLVAVVPPGHAFRPTVVKIAPEQHEEEGGRACDQQNIAGPVDPRHQLADVTSEDVDAAPQALTQSAAHALL